eukprot:GHVQ01024262.1.p1 GENE.GHVQ01024262.1~~GHVQ01024262.1.p1  ORF type:complete len:834 (+),score=62.92 GHVQ01024262.1:130-2631(+)
MGSLKTGNRVKRRRVEAVVDDQHTRSSDDVFSDLSFDGLSLFGLQPRLIGTVKHHGLSQMTRIQAIGIPIVMKGHDTMVRAQTGSGKTLVFAIPAIQRVLDCSGLYGKGEQPAINKLSMEGPERGVVVSETGPVNQYRRSDGTKVMIVCPTRELCMQTLEVVSKLSQLFPWIVVTSLTGGDKRKSEKSRLRKGVTIIVCTPGRLLDHVETTTPFSGHVGRLDMLILDEADRLLDMGFDQKLRKIYQFLVSSHAGSEDSAKVGDRSSSSRLFQTVLVSATLTPSVQRLASFCMKGDVQWVNLGDGNDASLNNPPLPPKVEYDQTGGPVVTEDPLESSGDCKFEIPSNLQQYYVKVDCKTRFITLISILRSRAKLHSKVVVFVSNCDSVEYLHELTRTVRWPTAKYIGLEGKQDRRLQSSTHRREEESCDSDPDEVSQMANFLKSPKKYRLPQFDKKEAENLVSSNDSAGDTTEIFAGELVFEQFNIFKLHGSLPREDRIGYLADFSKSDKAVLFTTDVAARGLNLPEVSWIVQYDPPQHVDEYVHRVGRTARLNATGNAILFLQEQEIEYINVLKSSGVNIHAIDNDYLIQPLISEDIADHLRRIRSLPQYLASFFCKMVSNEPSLLTKARTAYFATIRSYHCFSSSLKKIFNPKKIHLGHFATSFGLAESPSAASQQFRIANQRNGAAGDRVVNRKDRKRDRSGNRKDRSDTSDRAPLDAGAWNTDMRVPPKKQDPVYPRNTFASATQLFGPIAQSTSPTRRHASLETPVIWHNVSEGDKVVRRNMKTDAVGSFGRAAREKMKRQVCNLRRSGCSLPMRFNAKSTDTCYEFGG